MERDTFAMKAETLRLLRGIEPQPSSTHMDNPPITGATMIADILAIMAQFPPVDMPKAIVVPDDDGQSLRELRRTFPNGELTGIPVHESTAVPAGSLFLISVHHADCPHCGEKLDVIPAVSTAATVDIEELFDRIQLFRTQTKALNGSSDAIAEAAVCEAQRSLADWFAEHGISLIGLADWEG